jgi:methylated-DNA-[protein]-cysteine S-methyltransferase
MPTVPPYITYLESPLGWIAIGGTETHVNIVSFVDTARESSTDVPDCLLACTAQLGAYFEGERLVFDVPIAPQGTAFQLRVWHALLDIQYGHTTSYGQIAQQLGDPKTTRAVGAANGSNPIAIIIPCHRVIGADGSLTGYAGGMDKKRWLLRLEALTRGMSQPELF